MLFIKALKLKDAPRKVSEAVEKFLKLNIHIINLRLK
jgi:hypothetical protein